MGGKASATPLRELTLCCLPSTSALTGFTLTDRTRLKYTADILVIGIQLCLGNLDLRRRKSDSRGGSIEHKY